MQHWLFKSEPGDFSIDDLAAAPGRKTHWDGVRNYQARNILRDQVRKGDLVLFYHSSTEPAGIAGLCEVTRAAYPDHTALDPKHPHYDPAATAADPRWYMVDIRLRQKFRKLLTLSELRMHKALFDMELLRRGSRLSVQPVTPRQFEAVMSIASP